MALEELLAAEGHEAVARAAGQVVAGALCTPWSKDLGLKESSGHVCRRRLLGQ